MKKYRFAILLLLSLAVFIVVMAGVLRGSAFQSATTDAHFSVILCGSDGNDRWNALDQGIRQACRELEIETPVHTVLSEPDTQTLSRILRREAEGGARGLLIAVDDSAAMAEALADARLNVPLEFIINGPAGGAYVSADDAAVALALAKSLAGETGHIALLPGNTQRESVRARLEIFLGAMRAQGQEVAVLALPEDRDIAAAAASELTFHRPMIDVLVALDTDTLETIIDAAEAAVTDARICGIGSSDKVAHALSQGALDWVVFENEYAIGYIGAMRLAARMGLVKNPAEGGIQYMCIDQQSMYGHEAERLLFPLIQ